MKTTVITFLFSFIFLVANAQRDRYRFAETYFGFEGEFVSEDASFSYFDKDGALKEETVASTLSPRILIGGTHFWGHADFYISIPLANIKLNGSDALSYNNDVLTGFRVLPFQLKNKMVRPFLGVGLNGKSLEIENGPFYTNWQWFFEGGLNYRFKNKILGLEMRYFPKSDYQAAISRTDFESIQLSPLSFSLTYKKALDFTASYSRESSKRYMKKIYEMADEAGAYSAFSFGFGLSALIPLSKTELASKNAFFNDEIEGSLMLDIGVGYYSKPLNSSFRVSYRPLKSGETAHDYTFELKQHSLAFEAFKFIGDYHGFAPFVGPYVSLDRYALLEKDFDTKITDLKTNKLGYGIIFGWDIKQTEADYITLRTNLRYTPEFNHQEKGYKFTANQLEFNFIQIVFYPERYKLYKTLNKKS